VEFNIDNIDESMYRKILHVDLIILMGTDLKVANSCVCVCVCVCVT